MRHNPMYIFDLDGTLANIEHRVHILKNTDNSNRWRDFYAACDKDEPNRDVIRVMENMRLFADILIRPQFRSQRQNRKMAFR